ncbi:RNA-processing protein PTA1 CYBJADRAFT_166900 [Cyberlindnera jadinii NRRL Y-1542]|uniref:Symplekin/Pta1 N-terminal domain-containing protein n=1 Tax=Cyberlindnera jadinii (strain ATCC 18201 / CBS 1600 / BCRC 20928 / JCM 3617 / NBRC 0987 / NRRL Y-1542) TaxID=983966 RepID=A0A1E4S3V6_CYBJN|nr:hypothetical protein CYBJADRAFT_166900 [Cyberlindnera jadinii NRRL Y-1542]ODV74184.1 hypothetical protein CYBJADRAFT_166900 [Cyberlindnera jadinii NRRL Y-1542]
MSAEEVIQGLSQVRGMLSTQPDTFPQVIQAVCGMASTTPHLEVQQWCSKFFVDTFSSEFTLVPWSTKQNSLASLLPVLMTLSSVKDVYVYKNVVLTSTCVYDMAFDLVAKVSNQSIWNDMTALKTKIIQDWDTTYPLTPSNDDTDKFKSIGSRLASTKFISKVIVVQSAPLQSSDPRRRATSASNEISINQVHPNHTVLNKLALDVEAQKLLDTITSYLQAEEYLVPQVLIAIIETLVCIIQRRKQFIPKVFQAIASLDLDSKYQQSKDKFIKFKLMKRFVERAIKNALNYCMKAGLITPQLPQNGTFQTMVSSIDARMAEQRKKGILTELPGEKARRKIKVDPKNPFPRDATTVEDNSYTSLYQLIDETNPLLDFDASLIPQETLANIAIATIASVDTNKLITALSIVSARYTDLITKAGGSVLKQEVKDEDLKDDDLDNERILNANDDFNLESTFVLPEPKPFTEEQKKRHLQLIINNFFDLSKLPANHKSISSFNVQNEQVATSVKVADVAINEWGKNSWLLLLSRLATRGIASEDHELGDLIREAIYQYFVDNIHERIDVAIEWLNEEWFTEVTTNSSSDDTSRALVETPTYLKWAEKVLDSVIPFLESNDRKIFIRLLSDLPFLNAHLVSQIKSLCIDPQRSALGFQSLQFLILFRPPVKQACIEILRDLYENNEDLKTTTASLLKKYDTEFKPVDEPKSTEDSQHTAQSKSKETTAESEASKD